MDQEWIKIEMDHLLLKTFKKVKGYVDIGEKEGAKLVVDGEILKSKDMKMDFLSEAVCLIM